MIKNLNIYNKLTKKDLYKRWLLILFVVMVHLFCLVVINKSI